METESQDREGYYSATEVIDWQQTEVKRLAAKLADGAGDKVDVARRCYLFVRDEIDHSFDVAASAVTCSASEVLKAGHGICYAKSHLLAALLRANGLAAGFGYQRLSDDQGGYALHGYTTVRLPVHGWYRCDARGNVGGVEAHFMPPVQRLAFATTGRGEVDYGLNLAQPLPSVVRSLQQSADCEALRAALPTAVLMG